MNEMLDAIDAAVGPVEDDPGVSVREYAESKGISIEIAARILNKAVAEGRLVRGRGRRARGNSRNYPMTVYRPA